MRWRDCSREQNFHIRFQLSVRRSSPPFGNRLLDTIDLLVRTGVTSPEQRYAARERREKESAISSSHLVLNKRYDGNGLFVYPIHLKRTSRLGEPGEIALFHRRSKFGNRFC